MARRPKQISVENKIDLIRAVENGQSVSKACRSAGISRQTYYKILERYRTDGLEGLSARSSKPHKVRSEDAVLADLIKKRILQRPSLSIRKLQELIRRQDSRAVPVSTIHKYLLNQGLSTPANRLEYFEIEIRVGNQKLTERQEVFVTGHNPCHLDRPLLDGCSDHILQVGYHPIRFNFGSPTKSYERNMVFCVDARTGVLVSELTDSAVGLSIAGLVEKSLISRDRKDIKVLVCSRKHNNEICQLIEIKLKTFRQMFGAQSNIYPSTSNSIACGMFLRITKQLRKSLSRPNVLSIRRKNPDNAQILLERVTDRWNTSILPGYPIYGKSPSTASKHPVRSAQYSP